MKNANNNNDMPQIGVRLTLDQKTDLDQLADESGGRFNRSDLIRRFIDEGLARDKAQRRNL